MKNSLLAKVSSLLASQVPPAHFDVEVLDLEVKQAVLESERHAKFSQACKDLLEILQAQGVEQLQYHRSQSGHAGAASIAGNEAQLSPVWTEHAQSAVDLIAQGVSIQTGNPQTVYGETIAIWMELSNNGDFVMGQQRNDLYNDASMTVRGNLANVQSFSPQFDHCERCAPVAYAEVKRMAFENKDHVAMSDEAREQFQASQRMRM